MFDEPSLTPQFSDHGRIRPGQDRMPQRTSTDVFRDRQSGRRGLFDQIFSGLLRRCGRLREQAWNLLQKSLPP